MITPDYCQMMARYNAWQNAGLRKNVGEMSKDALMQDRGAFFGSIINTLNHLLWADLLWMSRFDGGQVPAGTIQDSVHFTPTPAVWGGERFRADGRIIQWADGLSALDLTGDLTWFSGAMGCDVERPMAVCVAHFFNHQTHHRGQIHAMLTAAGTTPGDTDLFIMPKEPPWS